MSKVTKTTNQSNTVDHTATSITAWHPLAKVEFYNYNGEVITDVLACAIIQFIESYDLCATDEFEQGVMTFSGTYDNPSEYEEVPVSELTAMEYLEAKFEKVTERFYNEVLLAGRSLTNAA